MPPCCLKSPESPPRAAARVRPRKMAGSSPLRPSNWLCLCLPSEWSSQRWTEKPPFHSRFGTSAPGAQRRQSTRPFLPEGTRAQCRHRHQRSQRAHRRSRRCQPAVWGCPQAKAASPRLARAPPPHRRPQAPQAQQTRLAPQARSWWPSFMLAWPPWPTPVIPGPPVALGSAGRCSSPFVRTLAARPLPPASCNRAAPSSSMRRPEVVWWRAQLPFLSRQLLAVSRSPFDSGSAEDERRAN